MEAAFTRHLPLAGTFNVRDLGGYAAGGRETRWRRVLRADGLHRLDDTAMELLVGEGVRTIIDLRHAGELVMQPNPLNGHPNIAYHNISLFDQLAPAHAQGEDILLDLYKQALAQRQSAIRDVLTIIADAPDGIVLFHCTAGKDRTGIVTALLLAIAGVEAGVIVEDYAMTGAMIAPMVEELVAGALARGLDVEAFRPLLAAEPATMLATLEHLEQTYGSARDYLALIGLENSAIERLRDRLLGDQ